MVAVCWEDNPEDLLQRLEEIHRGDQPPRMGEIPGETPGDHINRKKRKRSGARVKDLRTYRENENPRIAAGIFLWDALQLVLSPNPPMDTDGRREDSGRGVRKLQKRWSGLDSGRREVGGRSAGAFGGTDGGLQWLW